MRVMRVMRVMGDWNLSLVITEGEAESRVLHAHPHSQLCCA